MVHWLANAYAKKGITVNGIAPALIEETKMLPGSSEELSKSKCTWGCLITSARDILLVSDKLTTIRNPHRPTWQTGRDC
jgi:NAD(P)-dependent dehydrogenase (short-subunit alcohol dehydrogenase family)